MSGHTSTTRDRKRPGFVGRVAGIDVYIHWSFVALVGWIFFSQFVAGKGLSSAIEAVTFILSIFACVFLHELGHALAARKFQVETRDITLYPIGGVARLERIPERPSEELWVAIAGPLVNFALAGGLAVIVAARGDLGSLWPIDILEGDFFARMLQVNLTLAVFNLIPAFPMDGGRVLRALLAMRMNHVRATQYAATAGKTVAVLMGIVGLFGNFMLLFIAMFVFIGAGQEAVAVQTRSVLSGVPVRAAMVTTFKALDANASVQEAIALLLSTEQQDFPVVDGDRVAGVLPRAVLLKTLAEGRADAAVHEVMITECETVDASEMLDRAFPRMQAAECSMLPVVHRGRLEGIITLENVGEWMMVHSALAQARDRSELGTVWQRRLGR